MIFLQSIDTPGFTRMGIYASRESTPRGQSDAMHTLYPPSIDTNDLELGCRKGEALDRRIPVPRIETTIRYTMPGA